jgi:hypothetical protein
MSKTREYLAKTKQCEQLANKTRYPEIRDWQLTLARAYRRLAEFEQDRVNRRPVVA